MMNYREMLYKQLAYDFSCTVEQIKSNENVFLVTGINDKTRKSYNVMHTKMYLVCINNKIIVRSENADLIAWMEKEFSDCYGEWFSEFENFRKLEEGLKPFGLCIYDFKPFTIPFTDVYDEKNLQALEQYEIKYYNQEEIMQFEDDDRFSEAFAFEDDAPDMIGVSASLNGEIYAMAGANAISDLMWEIGANVVEGHEGKGLGTGLATLLKKKVEEKGIMPYCGTATSHISSRVLAIKAGFIPAYVELITSRIE